MTDYAAASQAIVEGRLKDAWRGSINLVDSSEQGPFGVIEWHPAAGTVVLHRTLRESPRLAYFATKIPPTLAILEAAAAASTAPLVNTPVPLNLDDIPSPQGIAFVSDSDDKHLLVPDPNFIRFDGYSNLRSRYATPPHWRDRIPVVFWRGGTSGRHPGGDWRRLQRIQLCQLALREPMIDAGITHVAQLPEGAEAEIKAQGLRRARIPAELFHLYRAHIAVDGNSWPTGFFCALLTGSPVLKIASPNNFRQWYYSELKPWVHFVPVAADLCDIAEKSAWVLADGNRAAKIGEAGRAFARCMTSTREIIKSGAFLARRLSSRKNEKIPVRAGPADQGSIIQSLLRAHPDMTRLIFVHIPKCAGTDLSVTLNKYPSIHQTLGNPNWQDPATLTEAVAQIEKRMADQTCVLVHGHIHLSWVVKNQLSRAGDRLFTIVRDPKQQLISQINYIAGRLRIDPTGKDPDTSQWLNFVGRSNAINCTTDVLVEIAHRQIQPDPICHALGDGTVDGALSLIRQSGIEITDTDRYARWGEATWGVPFTTRHNTSKAIIADLDDSVVEQWCNRDLELYRVIRASLGEELAVFGDAL